jgi:lipid II:glycine glycyltransferase (peptidoglycan interpeptide bridge formation enzyme)
MASSALSVLAAGSDRSDYEIRASTDLDDSDWDAFLRACGGGCHVQASSWARYKAAGGWRPVRLIARRFGRIVGGVQILEKDKRPLGNIGYAPKGPIVDAADPSLMDRLVAEMRAIAVERRMRLLAVQPYETDRAYADSLTRGSFVPTILDIGPLASVVNDLSVDDDTMLRRMHKKTRAHVRQGLSRGVRVREGNVKDLQTFHDLLTSTSKRQGFTPEPFSVYQQLWHELQSDDQVRLFLVEYGRETVSGALVIPFGDTVVYKRGAWSGRHSDRYPNESMHWTVMQWARSHGYRFYDFEGIDPAAARAVLSGETLPKEFAHTLTRFKLNFGGTPTLFGNVYRWVSNPILRMGYASIVEPSLRSQQVQRFVGSGRS